VRHVYCEHLRAHSCRVKRIAGGELRNRGCVVFGKGLRKVELMKIGSDSFLDLWIEKCDTFEKGNESDR
jgi:hypothetical protein